MNQLFNNSLFTVQTLAHCALHTSTAIGTTTTITTTTTTSVTAPANTNIMPCECHIKVMLSIITVTDLSVICHITVRAKN